MRHALLAAMVVATIGFTAAADAAGPRTNNLIVSNLSGGWHGGTQITPCNQCVLYHTPTIGEKITLNPQPLPPRMVAQ